MNNRSNISSNIMSRMKVFETNATKGNAERSTVSSERGERGCFLAAAQLSGIHDIANTTTRNMMMSSPPPGVQTDADGLILPKKIINPCLESSDRKQLHRELKFNTKVGKNVLNQKSELQRAYEKQKERQQLLHQTQDGGGGSPTSSLKGELSRVIMERAQKQEQQPTNQTPDSDDDDRQYVNPEYLNARARLRAGQRTELK